MHYDLAIIGSGIVGLGHVWAAAKRGYSVAVFEADSHPEGASIRNFGMIWPIGQPAGSVRALSLRNQQLWQELGEAVGFPVEQCGSVFLAHHEDEMQVLKEFADSACSQDLDLQVLNPAETLQHLPAANPNGLKGGLYSRTECRVHPPTAITSIVSHLGGLPNVDLHFETPIVKVHDGSIQSADGKSWTADRIIIASGAYFKHLFPEQHRNQQFKICKLQMLLTVPQPDQWKLGPHMASGLTLRHYSAFDICPTLTQVRQRVATTMPELDRYGIHVMASSTPNGELILGDSHEYGEDIEPFDKDEIDQLILREIHKVLQIPQTSIARRWSGFYAKHPHEMYIFREIEPRIHLVNGFGGNGMTLSLAASDSVIEQLANSNQMS
ncbi:TIGR03364 family FAD-dependent oxidoreductase [Rubinisphaera sp.]|uniref:TIGR03364 family FAD-dependent oxidoreductase n=1 Tax=Rubinisphaera sp. TaxID=2024857 RepID=UPI000C0C7451|nr:TIGR03364 family FAD-dependent oxidoreductase [Rubinisphaera sp.]MBV10060.1 TIGR03364 family FAD-dependent oxidoreductase [Rubinisphaera sp.]HCS53776.1 TIGR03364 family FAD-dependent oxidoreductase [Planctomycetaceae bacterium]|tara:strand:+ start:1940 stop:3085 length:1146 start_codon:yes stop_codon:yes gene_type:complete